MGHGTGHHAKGFHAFGIGQFFHQANFLLQGDFTVGDVADSRNLHLASLEIDMLDPEFNRKSGAVLS